MSAGEIVRLTRSGDSHGRPQGGLMKALKRLRGG